MPLQSNVSKEFLWSTEYLIDRLTVALGSIKIQIEDDGADHQVITVNRYYSQALKLAHLIPVASPPPPFVVSWSDLPKDLQGRLLALDKDRFGYAVRLAVGRIFENIDSDLYHISIARSLVVRIEP
jgi:hypothetical protein